MILTITLFFSLILSGCNQNLLGDQIQPLTPPYVFSGEYNVSWLAFTNTGNTSTPNYSQHTITQDQSLVFHSTIGFTNALGLSPSNVVILKLNNQWVCSYNYYSNYQGYLAWDACQFRLSVKQGDVLRFENYPRGTTISLAIGVPR